MELLTTREFNGIQLDCYKADNVEDDFLATREQIGRLLGYSDPVNSIMKIHTRNADRLDKFSTWVKLSQVEGNRTVIRDVIVYNFKGLLEICRYSNKPKANAVMDFLWSVAKDIRKYGMYLTPEAFNALVKAYIAEKEKVLSLQAKIDANGRVRFTDRPMLTSKGVQELYKVLLITQRPIDFLFLQGETAD